MQAFLRLSLACTFALSVACGSIANKADAGGGGDDASGGDGGGNVADAAPDAATFGMVTVNVFVGGNPAPSVAVMYHKADGSYIGSMLTDSNGQVIIADMPVGGAVTAPVSPYGDASTATKKFLTSVTHVQLGDVISIGRSTLSGSDPTAGTMSVTMPGTFAGARTYAVTVGCNTSTTATAGASLKPVIQSSCVPSSNAIDVVAYARDGSGNRIAYSAVASVPLSGTAPNMTGSVNMPAWQTGLGLYTLALNNAPADIQVNPSFVGYKQDVRVDAPSTTTTSVAMGTGLSTPFLMIPGFFQSTSVAVRARIPVGQGTADSYLAKRADVSPTAANPEQVSWDLTTDLLQPPTSVTVTADTVTSVAWSGGTASCSDNPSLDSIIYAVSGGVQSTGITYEWYALASGTQSSPIALPQLDPALAQALWPTASFDSTAALVLLKADSAQTYDDFRLSDDNFGLLDPMPDHAGTRCITYGGAG